MRSILALPVALCALACLAPLAPASAQTTSAPPDSQQLWLAVEDTALAQLRGGFALGDGLLVSLGITRALYINGALVTETSLHLNAANPLDAAQAARLGQQLQSLNLVQNGPGNVFQAGSVQTLPQATAAGSAILSSVSGLGPGTIVQNSLSGQNVLNRTTIDASSSGLSLLRAAQFQSDISQAVMQAIGAR